MNYKKNDGLEWKWLYEAV